VVNCEVFGNPGLSSNCVVLAPNLSGITVSNNNIHDCQLGIYCQGSNATINNNTIQNFTNGINSLGTSNVNNNTFYCSGGGDAINGCQGTAVYGSGNYCSGCTIGCNGCSGSPNCYQSTQMFWIASSTCM
jgi:parallel beta-helix repeat protein